MNDSDTHSLPQEPSEPAGLSSTPPASAPPASPPATPAPPNTIFQGPNGLRAGWRVLMFLGFLIVAALIVGGIAAALLIAFLGAARVRQGGFQVSSLTPLGTGFSEGGIFLCTALAALTMARIEKRKFGCYGLPISSALGKDFWIGSVAGFAAISGCLLAIFALHGFRLTGLAIRGSTIISATIAWGLAFLLVGLSEEFTFRGYLQFTLTTGMGFWPSAFLLSALFGLAHATNPGESKAGLLSVVVFGLLFCLFLRRTGNLWWAVGFHAGWDWGQTFFYGVPDSGLLPYHNLFNSSFSGPRWLTGGSVGPEASLFTPVTLVIVAILFTRVYRENRYQAQIYKASVPPVAETGTPVLPSV